MAIFVLIVLCFCLLSSSGLTHAAADEYDRTFLVIALTFDLILILAIIFQSISL